ncbi:MAG: phenylacetate-CoA oxygenase subunit PaaC [Alphaproteobacteria bacterium]|nr:phenylacetate-CoA oxygenase subunit PaaC [Alphaproteobacteria bacterium]
MTQREALFEFLQHLGDNTLILSHRVSEWCGHAPVIEEDIALANTALDLIGQAQMWLGLAAEIEGAGRDADALTYHRDSWDFRNLLLVERPNGDFGKTLMRQFLFDAWQALMLEKLARSEHKQIAAIAGKAIKEVAYHLERSGDTVIGLGDGTEESHARMQAALDDLWPYCGEMFNLDERYNALILANILPRMDDLRARWLSKVTDIFDDATLVIPTDNFAHSGGKSGRHTEHLGHLLCEMQVLQRSYPGAKW